MNCSNAIASWNNQKHMYQFVFWHCKKGIGKECFSVISDEPQNLNNNNTEFSGSRPQSNPNTCPSLSVRV